MRFVTALDASNRSTDIDTSPCSVTHHVCVRLGFRAFSQTHFEVALQQFYHMQYAFTERRSAADSERALLDLVSTMQAAWSTWTLIRTDVT